MAVSKKRLGFVGGAIRTLFLVLACGIVFVIVEGLSSTAISGYQMLSNSPLSTLFRYDETLGWIGIPNTYVPDAYGPGKYVRTNSRGFRDDDEIAVRVPRGKLRIVCSGDSFTYGQGVANNQTWCHRFSELDDRYETANLGQSGYGVDQFYLRYMRDGVNLEHSIHVFAFVAGDLTRMGYMGHNGKFGKPVLKVDQDEIVADNIPVPRFRWWASRMVKRADFRFVDLSQRVFRRLSNRKAASAKAAKAKAKAAEGIKPVASKVFETIQQISAEKNIIPLFVYLPTEADLKKDTQWRHWVAATMNTLALPFVDLTPALRGLPPHRVSAFFIPRSMPGGGHYTEAGNEWVAELLHSHLTRMPQVQTLLAEANAPQIETAQTGNLLNPESQVSSGDESWRID